DVTDAHASASCKNGVPALTGSSKVTNLRIDSQNIGDAGGSLPPFGDGQHFIVAVNEQIKTKPTWYDPTAKKVVQLDGEELIQRALEIYLAKDATNYIRFVIGEARVGYHGTATELCSPPPARCPEGANYDASRGV